jgi:hypothetical protein
MAASMQQIIESRILPHLEYLLEKIEAEQEATMIDGVKAFSGEDFFVPGKTINACSYILTAARNDPAKYRRWRAAFQEMLRFTAKYEIKTWGIFFYLTGLNRLREAGLLDEILTDPIRKVLQEKLDWRKFIHADDLSLINLPTNYYGCGFGVARLRELLGWENEKGSQRLFDRLMEHIAAYSGEDGFADETAGEGRFDRYSVLLPGEICARLVDTGMPVPETLRRMLRRSCDIHLMLADENGHGFSYGRTLGPYGDTSVLEVLSIGAYLDILNDSEKELAYQYCLRIIGKFVDFWLDAEMHSVNMWEKGRSADPYMGKERILGENFSLCHQIIHSAELWNRQGFSVKKPDPGFAARLEGLPRHYLARFSSAEYERALIIVRDEAHIFSLPLISGGNHQYQNGPYLPIPFENNMLSCAPSEPHPQLVPKIYLRNGRVLMPLAYIKKIQLNEDGAGLEVSYLQDELCRVGGNDPVPEPGWSVKTFYRFSPGCITREDCFKPGDASAIQRIELEFATYSRAPLRHGNKVIFRIGTVYGAEVDGLDQCSIETVEEETTYRTPHGALQNRVLWYSERPVTGDLVRIRWSLWYR